MKKVIFIAVLVLVILAGIGMVILYKLGDKIIEEAITSETTLSDNAAAPAQETVITPEQIKEIKDRVSPADKITAAGLVLKRLKASDIDKLKNMVLGGVSPEEREEAKKIAYSRFTPEEIKIIKAMCTKYMNQAQTGTIPGK